MNNSIMKKQDKAICFISNPGSDPKSNLDLFTQTAKRSRAFGNINWETICWDITEFQIKDRGHKQRVYNLWFTQHGSKKPKKLGEPFAEPFASFAKALIRLRHEYGNQTAGNHMVVLGALRYLYQELEYQDYDPLYVNTDHFIRAEKKAGCELSARSARQVGVYLTNIARTINANRLAKVRIYFHTALPTSEAKDRLSDAAKQRRERLLPKQNVLHALAKISQKLNNDEDRLCVNIIKILLFTGFRIGEALTLPANTLVLDDSENVINHQPSIQRIGLRYWPEKGAEPRVKWLPTEAGKLVKTAIEETIALTSAQRKLVKWFDNHPNKLDVEIKPECLMDMEDVAQFVGVKNGAQYCKRRNIPIIEEAHNNGGYRKWYVQFKDLEEAIVKQCWNKPMLRLPNGKVQTLSDSLCLVFHEQFHHYHATIKWLVRPISESNISYFLCGAKGIKNVFERYGHLDEEGTPLKVRSHDFRHLLNTLANEGGLTDVELACWFGRKNIKDNQAYDHRTADQITEKARQMMLSGTMVGPIANAARQLPQSEAEIFVRAQVNAVHHTPYGVCVHDFAQTPCDKHLNCLSNCKEYHRTIGNIEERKNLLLLKKQTQVALDHSKQQLSENTWGANQWVVHHQNMLKNINKALSIDEDVLSQKKDKHLTEVFEVEPYE